MQPTNEQPAPLADTPTESSEVLMPHWVPESVQSLIERVAEYPIPAMLGAVLLFFLLCKTFELVAGRVLSRMAGLTKTDLDDKLFKLIHKPVFPTAFFLGLTLLAPLLELPDILHGFLRSVLLTLVVLVWLSALFPAKRLLLDSLSRNAHRLPFLDERTLPLFAMIGKIVLIGVGSYALLAIWHIDPRPWLASAGILGIAVGFAAKDTLANLFGGFFILADSPYKLGDFVNLDSGIRGKVTHIGIRSTRMLTRDDIEITVPNAQIANATIINESGGPWEKERIRIKVGVAYGSDVDQVCEVLREIAQSRPDVSAEPLPRVRMRAFGASSLDFELLCWIDQPVLRGKISHELYMAIYKRFAEEEIEIPYSKHDLYIKEMPGSA